MACHNLQRLAAYADESAAADDGDRNREMALQLLSAFSRELDNDPMYFPEMMSALMFYYDSPTQVLIQYLRACIPKIGNVASNCQM